MTPKKKADKGHGWNVVVIGSPRVQHQPGECQYNFEFVVRFTGAKKAEPARHEGE